MKKITIVFLTAVYLLTVVGVSASSFYCCGILKTTSLTIGASHDGDQPPAKSHKCCKTVKLSFKIKDNHFASDISSLSVKQITLLCQPVPFFKWNAEPLTTVFTAFNKHAPPLAQHRPIYTLNCTYRI